MLIQSGLTALIVSVSFLYACWILMPSTWRRKLAVQLLKRYRQDTNGPSMATGQTLRNRFTARLRKSLQSAAQADDGSCHGCENAASHHQAQADGAKPIRFYRRID
jgi:hypothetical protein